MNKKILLVILGGIVAFTLYKSYYYDNIFQIFIYLLFGIPFIIILIKSILEETKSYKANNKLTIFSNSLIGIFVLLIIIGIYSYNEEKVNKPSLIKARIFGGYADFKQNGEYVFVCGSWASRSHFYGTYKIKDSIITVDRKEFDDVLTTNRFVIRNSDSLITENYKHNEITIDKYLIQIDKNGKEIKRKYNQCNYRLPIVVDNLK
ncbi:hypothetical protein LX97_03154 [Nonlabens dokdonensis]|jgi:hypothetical protein|uniref:Uncharacterized protein n=2 Tax=Nonlabens dokdonensis TaxID=328515 RepID=L7WCU5_NONDD|nr:hypothetical protein [Nonlabens dokdonensis]AGC78067.1 hypothetical protein DDD_2940 [Nonlabens dokdonensis DSW-6]PZX37132.1 hypothetical protein LX97_03154 [Nonlabens dokdonensis]